MFSIGTGDVMKKDEEVRGYIITRLLKLDKVMCDNTTNRYLRIHRYDAGARGQELRDLMVWMDDLEDLE